MSLEFCPQEVAWGDIATWVAAVATFAAVLVALRTSNQALRQAKEIRDADQREAEDVRKLRARAYSAAVVDDTARALTHLRLAADLLKADGATDYEKAFAVIGELSEIDTAFFQRMLEHVEVFESSGKLLARMTMILMEAEQSAKRNLELLRKRGDVPNGFLSLYDRLVRKDILYLRECRAAFL